MRGGHAAFHCRTALGDARRAGQVPATEPRPSSVRPLASSDAGALFTQTQSRPSPTPEQVPHDQAADPGDLTGARSRPRSRWPFPPISRPLHNATLHRSPSVPSCRIGATLVTAVGLLGLPRICPVSMPWRLNAALEQRVRLGAHSSPTEPIACTRAAAASGIFPSSSSAAPWTPRQVSRLGQATSWPR